VVFYKQHQVFDIKNLTKLEKPYLCTMNVAAQIRGKIKSMPEGSPFGYADLGVDKKDFLSAAKSLERLQKKRSNKESVQRAVLYSKENRIWRTRARQEWDFRKVFIC
jgi:hypothetical protein